MVAQGIIPTVTQVGLPALGPASTIKAVASIYNTSIKKPMSGSSSSSTPSITVEEGVTAGTIEKDILPMPVDYTINHTTPSGVTGEPGVHSSISKPTREPANEGLGVSPFEERKVFLKRKLDAVRTAAIGDPEGPPKDERSRSQYSVHIVGNVTKKKLISRMQLLLDEEYPSKIIGGRREELDQLIIEGCSSKNGSLLRMVQQQLKTTSPPLTNFSFTNTLITTDIGNAASDINSEIPTGTRALWAWSEDASLKMKLGGSKWFNLHGKMITWDYQSGINFKVKEGIKCYLIYNYVLSSLGELEETEREALKDAGFCPSGVHRDEASDSDSTIPEEDQEADPTEGLPPVIMPDAWTTTGPPGMG